MIANDDHDREEQRRGGGGGDAGDDDDENIMMPVITAAQTTPMFMHSCVITHGANFGWYYQCLATYFHLILNIPLRGHRIFYG